MSTPESATGRLLRLAEQGDQPAIELLFEGHRDKLRRMVAVRMDARLRSRLDPSDVVQETLAEASAKLGEYLRRGPVSFHAWLRQLAWDRLVGQNREQIGSKMPSVTREQKGVLVLASLWPTVVTWEKWNSSTVRNRVGAISFRWAHDDCSSAPRTTVERLK